MCARSRTRTAKPERASSFSAEATSSVDTHRRVQSTSLRLVSAAPPFSCFGFVEAEFGDQDAVRRCFSLARSLGMEVVTVEDIPADGLVADENGEIPGWAPDHQMSGLKRLAFWSCSLDHDVDISNVSNDALVGYAILKRDAVPSRNHDEWHVFEAVFVKYHHEHNCVPSPRKYVLRVGPREFSVLGVLYCQQNGLNKACAHVALRSLLSRRLPEGDIPYSVINASARKDARGVFEPHRGLGVVQIRRVLQDLGIPFRDIDYDEEEKADPDVRSKVPFQKYIYGGIESGAGSLLGFRLGGPAVQSIRCHIVPFYGHTFNKDTWVPDADFAYFDVGGGVGYIPSESWTSSFLGHDDNFGPNFCVPRQYVRNSQAEYALELLHDHFQYNGAVAEASSLPILYSLRPHLGAWANPWLKRLAAYIDQRIKRIVLRAVAIGRDFYLEQLEAARDWQGNAEDADLIDALGKLLPEQLWVVEISMPHLFPANERKLGDILLDPYRKPHSAKPAVSQLFLLARLPGKYVAVKSYAGGAPQFQEFPSRLESHTPLLRH